jgi:hypothetical protein
VSGIAASALAVLAPVKAGAEDRLVSALSALGDGEHGPFAEVFGTHFGRFAFVRRLTGVRGEDLEDAGAFLLMCADFDPEVEAWTASLCAQSGAQLDSVMAYCEGWPGSGDPAAVAEFFERHNAAPGFTVSGYRPASVTEVREKLGLRHALRALAVRAQAEELEGEALRQAWREAVGR